MTTIFGKPSMVKGGYARTHHLTGKRAAAREAKSYLVNRQFRMSDQEDLLPIAVPTTRSSNVGNDWLTWVESKFNIILCREYPLNRLPYTVDGYCCSTNTVYEFYGDYWHGNKFKYPSDMINKAMKKSMGELYINTLLREQEIINKGYRVISIWESDWTIQSQLNFS